MLRTLTPRSMCQKHNWTWFVQVACCLVICQPTLNTHRLFLSKHVCLRCTICQRTQLWVMTVLLLPAVTVCWRTCLWVILMVTRAKWAIKPKC
ncbi:Uncharacterised protein [Vibrio cholerae]|nr:Uncharacterised protein [Vibrio cholerae]